MKKHTGKKIGIGIFSIFCAVIAMALIGYLGIGKTHMNDQILGTEVSVFLSDINQGKLTLEKSDSFKRLATDYEMTDVQKEIHQLSIDYMYAYYKADSCQIQIDAYNVGLNKANTIDELLNGTDEKYDKNDGIYNKLIKDRDRYVKECQEILKKINMFTKAKTV